MLICLRREVQPQAARGMPVVREESFQRRCVAEIKTRGDGLTVYRRRGRRGRHRTPEATDDGSAFTWVGGTSAFLWVLKKTVTKNQFLLPRLARIL